ncbi:MAG TPA: TIGR01440 family protein [Bacillota bacterium]
MAFLEDIAAQARRAAEELLEAAHLKPGQILIVGGSTSEVAGQKIGSAGNREVAEAILQPIIELAKAARVRLAVQGCEHINRAVVVQRETAEAYGLEEVSVYPVAKAGGAMAATAMDLFTDPVVVEEIKAHAGLDIGDTFIGMHLRRVAVPVRLSLKEIGSAHLTAARTRPKLIGGERAVYVRPTDH